MVLRSSQSLTNFFFDANIICVHMKLMWIRVLLGVGFMRRH